MSTVQSLNTWSDDLYSDAQLNVLLNSDRILKTPKMASNILSVLDPECSEDKILEKGLGQYILTKGPLCRVDLKAMRAKSSKQYEKFRGNPKRWIYLLFFQWVNCYKEVPKISFVDADRAGLPFSEVKQKFNQYVSISGIIRKYSQINAATISTTYQCRNCKKQTVYDTLWYQTLPTFTCQCGHKKCTEMETARVYETWVNLTLQADYNQEGLNLNETFDIRIKNPKMFDEFKPGETILVKGIVASESTEKATVRIYCDALCAYHCTKSTNHRKLQKSKKEVFETLLKEEDTWGTLKQNIFKNIKGLDHLKDCALLMILKGGKNTSKKTIHLLVPGDPGSGKSKTMKTLQKRFGGLYATGMGSTLAGLTASTTKDSQNMWQLEAGALVCANNSTLYLDEIDKMPLNVTNSLLESMEQQMVSVSKAGINMSLPAKTAVLGVLNPRNKMKFNDKESFMSQIGLPEPLVSRFDLICAIDRKDFKMEDYLKQDEGRTDDPKKEKIMDKLINEYINYAQHLEPVISLEVKKQIDQYFLKLVNLKIEELPIGPRQRASFIRLCEARAKAFLRETVQIDDLEFVKKLTSALYSKLVGYNIFSDQKILYVEDLLDLKLTKREMNLVEKILSVIQVPTAKNAIFLKVSELEPSIDLKEFRVCLKKMERDGVAYNVSEDKWVASKIKKVT